MEKDKIIIRNCECIEIDGQLYFIPEKYTNKMYIATEHKSLFNYILAHVMHTRTKLENLNMEFINKLQMDKYLISTEKIFAFLITGKLDNVIFSGWEKNILEKIPSFIIPKLNPLIVERLE